MIKLCHDYFTTVKKLYAKKKVNNVILLFELLYKELLEHDMC